MKLLIQYYISNRVGGKYRQDLHLNDKVGSIIFGGTKNVYEVQGMSMD